ncbi:RING-type E3 ubiquitin-protein ligase PPIL2, partial [Trichonephila inaurata madagascariensis]
ILDDDVVRYAKLKKKGYLQIVTNLGPLNIELHCDMTPKTCENFIKLSKSGYYDDTIFHRSIKNFMITTYALMPSNKDQGSDLPNRQWVVGGLDTLNKMEKIETDKNDKPLETIKILKIMIFVDPYQEVDDELSKLREEERLAAEKALVVNKEPKTKKLKTYHHGIGKYINSPAVENSEIATGVETKKKKNVTGKFGDFSAW